MQKNRRAIPRLAGMVTVAVCLTFSTAYAHSDGALRDLDATGSPIAAQPADPAIAAAIHSISPEAIHRNIEKLVAFHNRSTLSSMTPNLPPGTGITAAANWLFEQYTEIGKSCGGCLEVHRDTFTQQPGSRIPQPTVLTNIYAVLKGTDPAQAKRAVLVTGHYDTRVNDVLNTTDFAPGANDDSSGTAVSLACARALAKLHFPGTIIFATVAGEEQGLYGSKHLAKFLKDQGYDIEAALNNDIVGGNTTPGDRFEDKDAVRVFSEGVPATATPEEIHRILMLGYDSDSPSRELARAVTGIDATYFGHGTAPAAGIGAQQASYFHPVLEFRLDRFLRGGDHYSFNQQGFAAVRFTEWREDFHHQHQEVRVENGVQYGDLIQFDDFHYIANVARLNAATLATLAAAPPPPVDVQIVVSKLDNDSTLRWQPGPGTPAGTRYQILWRELAAPDWQRMADASQYEESQDQTGAAASASTSATAAASNATVHTATLPVSKDNVIFGVRAIDSHGHASYTVVPYPVR